jgi:wyosine [tRNA(Phe)-imidazoG37] synthetase (radical SAM superfamily)
VTGDTPLPVRQVDEKRAAEHVIAFGPVPSRRLGRSLGINNIPPKICTYSCAYCQLGRTTTMQAARRSFSEAGAVLSAVQDKVARTLEAGEAIDYLTFVPDGEPTLDANLGREIELLRHLGLPIAVITNSSLLWRQDVREELVGADWVSLKVDAVKEETWRRLDRPHRSLKLAAILEGALEFARIYEGDLVTETMVVTDVNDGERQLKEIAAFLARLHPDRAYLSIPTRPPAEEWAQPPDEQVLNRAHQIFSEKVDQVEYLIGYEGNAFAFTGDVEEDLLSITAVHPMRQDAVSDYLARAGAGWAVVHRLVAQGQLVVAEHGGHSFYLRKLGTHNM